MFKSRLLISSLILGLSISSTAFSSTAIDAFESKDYPKAKSLLSDHGDKAEKSFYLGRIALIENELDEAEELLEEALELKSDDADYHYWFGTVSMRQAANASIFSAPGYASDAREHLLKAVELNPKHIPAMKDLILFYSNAPSIAGGSMDKAIAMSKKLSDVDAMEGLASQLNIFRKQDEKDKELETAKQLEAQFPNSAPALLNAGFSFQRHEDYQKAFALFSKASQFQPMEDDLSPISSLYQMGKTAVISKEKTEEGIKALELYLTKDLASGLPGKNWAKFRLASLYQQKGNLDKAKKLAKEASKDKEDRSLRKRAKKLLKSMK